MSSAAHMPIDLAATLRAIDAEFIRYANANDAAGMTNCLYAENAQLLPPGAPMQTGKAAIQAFWTAFMTERPSDLSLTPDTIGQSGDLAYCTGHYAFQMGGERQQGKYVVVYQRQSDGAYKAVADAFNADA
jgi:ketosteroid isomerase-like protein